MRATSHKHFGCEASGAEKSVKTHKGVKALSFIAAFLISATALIIPTTTLAPNVDAYEDSKVSSFSLGDISEFSAVITNNCVEVTTAPVTEIPSTVTETTVQPKEIEEETEAATQEPQNNKKEIESEPSEAEENEETIQSSSDKNTETAETSSGSNDSTAYISSGGSLGYCPSYVSLSSYDRAKLERLVMGEAGSAGYTACALVAQSIRDAMNLTGTSSIDQIISQYQYYGSTDTEPNADVKNAVSFIFDQNGSAVQHRVLCFYTGYSSWHETQTFVTEAGGIRFFDLNV